MAHFAEINEDNIVLRILVVPNEQEHRGQDYLANDLNLGGRWIQTSYNSNIRVRYAGVGFKYDEEKDAFIAPQPFKGYVLNEETLDWVPPVPYPNDSEGYYWNEETEQWIKN
jgi:hypothetical protein